jgi:hypothetical protein
MHLINSLRGAFESAYFLAVYGALYKFVLNYSATFTNIFLKIEIQKLNRKDIL